MNIGLGIGEGLDDSTPAVLDSVSGVADAIASEFNDGSYKIGSLDMGADESILRGLDVFSDKIANSFSRLADRLQAIANSTSFTTPRAALGSVVPYTVQTEYRANRTGESTASARKEAVATVMEDMVQSNIAGHEATVAVLQQILEAVYSIDTSDERYARAVDDYHRKMAVCRGGY